MSISARFFRSFVMSFLLGFCTVAVTAQDENSAPPNVAPQGTVALIQVVDRLDTHTARRGDHFLARLAEPVETPSGLTLAAGSKIRGHISAVEPGLRRRLLLSFDEIDTGRGWEPFFATVVGVPGEHGMSQVGQEGEIGSKGMTKEEIAEAIVVGAGEGAREGMHNGGKRGAVQGAGNGAADGALTALENSHDLVLEKGTALEVRLDRNLVVPGR